MDNLPSEKALISLIFGLIGTLLVLPLNLFSTRIPALNFLFYISGGILGIFGLVLGIKSLKIVKSTTGVAGIILCIISILIWIYELLYIYAFFTEIKPPKISGKMSIIKLQYELLNGEEKIYKLKK